MSALRVGDGSPITSYHNGRVTIWGGDCLDLMAALAPDSVDAIVTDPPYGLGFMGKKWDDLPPGKEWAEACYRVLKPGGHLLAFGGTRTWHRLAVAIEDGGFEIRDSLAWLYGSGFPKSMDVSKAIDKAANAAPLWDEIRAHVRHWRDAAGLTNPALNAALGLATNGAGMARHWTSEVGGQHSIPSKDMWLRLKALLGWPDCDLDAVYDAVKAGAARPVIRTAVLPSRPGFAGETYGEVSNIDIDITAPATPEAQQWEGWGTALKPAFEPIVVGRKPLVGTVAANVLAHGTGALNIDACRIEHGSDVDLTREQRQTAPTSGMKGLGGSGFKADHVQPLYAEGGRWPANVVLDESQAEALDQQSGTLKSGVLAAHHQRAPKESGILGAYGSAEGERGYGDTGGASRFFYVAKAPKSERPVVELADGTKVAHPTVKPVAIMRWLVRLVTPPDGLVLDPFAGTGTTGEACVLEGFRCLLAEDPTKGEQDYLPLIDQRITRCIEQMGLLS